ncbi:MAG: site-specific DNA-methyltransferase, partial [Bacteroidota bacterium]|nr:site-specific DNA-methyltransferase [Bacteroidota bacterium]
MAKINRQHLIDLVNSLGQVSPEDKSQLLQLINEQKKYGLVWEDKPEEVEQVLKEKLPIIEEVKEKRILNDTEAEKYPNHIIIEGDNLHALTTLCYTHEGKIDVIYIDPPYNTGNKDFKYNDSFVDKEDEYKHSKWLSFMSKRLKLAKRLLSDKGVIFISIDDNEQAQLKLLCDSVLGGGNFICNFTWLSSGKKYEFEEFDDTNIKVLGANLGMYKSGVEYVLAYKKTSAFKFALRKTEQDFIDSRITKNGNNISVLDFPKGLKIYGKENIKFEGCVGGDSEKIEILTPEGMIFKDGILQSDIQLRSCFANPNMVKDFFAGKEVIDNREQKVIEIHFTSTGLPYMKKEKVGELPTNVLSGFGDTSMWRQKLINILGGEYFDYPKPNMLISSLLELHANKDATVLDFFA